MVLIVESGSTKSDWVLTDGNGRVKKFQTQGINPILLSEKEILDIIESNIELMKNRQKVSNVFFYAAGCGTEKTDFKMKEIFQKILPSVDSVIIKGDIEAAVYAVTDTPAVVCILGTGSNCCFFDGTNIIQKDPSLGYLLDDEGSGNAIGREVLRSYFYQDMPKEFSLKYEKEFDMNLENVLTQLYQNPFPNRYLANFAKLAIHYSSEPFFQKIIRSRIQSFLNKNLCSYQQEMENYPIHFIGSIAYYCRGLIKEELSKKKYISGKFIKSPMDHLMYTITK